MSALRLLLSNNSVLKGLKFQGTFNFHTSNALLAEPLKKKKRIDPGILRAREEKKKKKIEKMIRRLEHGEKLLKPIDECEVPNVIVKERSTRTRENLEIPENILNERISLLKQWSIFKYRRQIEDIKMCNRIILSQQRALDELKKQSLDLYNAAIQIDTELLPFSRRGPVETPPIESYDSPDGEYIDISKKWDH